MTIYDNGERMGLVRGPWTCHVEPFADFIVPPKPPETIAMAAIRCPYGRIFSLPRPARHGNIVWWMGDEYGYEDGEYGPEYQGFVTSAGRYVDRVEALKIAQAAGQIIEKHGNRNKLFSEDCW